MVIVITPLIGVYNELKRYMNKSPTTPILHIPDRSGTRSEIKHLSTRKYIIPSFSSDLSSIRLNQCPKLSVESNTTDNHEHMSKLANDLVSSSTIYIDHPIVSNIIHNNYPNDVRNKLKTLNDIIMVLINEYNEFRRLITSIKSIYYSKSFMMAYDHDKIHIAYKPVSRIGFMIADVKDITDCITSEITSEIYYKLIHNGIDQLQLNKFIFMTTLPLLKLVSSNNIDNVFNKTKYHDISSVDLHILYLFEQIMDNLIELPIEKYLTINDKHFETCIERLILNNISMY